MDDFHTLEWSNCISMPVLAPGPNVSKLNWDDIPFFGPQNIDLLCVWKMIWNLSQLWMICNSLSHVPILLNSWPGSCPPILWSFRFPTLQRRFPVIFEYSPPSWLPCRNKLISSTIQGLPQRPRPEAPLLHPAVQGTVPAKKLTTFQLKKLQYTKALMRRACILGWHSTFPHGTSFWYNPHSTVDSTALSPNPTSLHSLACNYYNYLLRA